MSTTSNASLNASSGARKRTSFDFGTFLHASPNTRSNIVVSSSSDPSSSSDGGVSSFFSSFVAFSASNTFLASVCFPMAKSSANVAPNRSTLYARLMECSASEMSSRDTTTVRFWPPPPIFATPRCPRSSFFSPSVMVVFSSLDAFIFIAQNATKSSLVVLPSSHKRRL